MPIARLPVAVTTAACLAVSTAGCYASPTRGLTAPGGTDAGAGDPDAVTDATTPTPSGDLPCEVVSLVAAHCAPCHDGAPTAPSPVVLTTRASLTGPADGFAGWTVAERAAVRMRDTTSPMPPAPTPPVSDGEISAFEGWIGSGYPTGSCGGDDGGALTDGARGDGGTNPYDTPTVCSSGSTWRFGDWGTDEMHPGRACITCHSREGEGPRYSIAGTVYPTAHEPDDCNGLSGGVEIVITDAHGAETRLSPNSAGNFKSRASLATPYYAKVVSPAGERAMASAQTDGDCNRCHTESGAEGAPGRVMAP